MTKNEKPLSGVSPRRQSRWVLADYGGKDLWKSWVLSLEWNSECVVEGESGELVKGELESVTSSAGCFFARLAETGSWFQRWSTWRIAKWAIGDS